MADHIKREHKIVYTVEFTDKLSNLPLYLQPGQFDGPDQSTAQSSLTLQGFGAIGYGLSINENFLHLLENFASPEDAENPGTPLSDIEGPVHFKNPITGQFWFNTTTNTMMMFDTSESWVSASGTKSQPAAPDSPNIGDLWYDTELDRLNVYNDSGSWEPVYARLLDGTETMSGNLKFSITTTDSLGIRWAGVTDSYHIYVENTDGGEKTRLVFRVADNYDDYFAFQFRNTSNVVEPLVDIKPQGINMYKVLNMKSNRIVDVADPTAGSDAINRDYADGRYVNVTGDTMTNDLNMGPGAEINLGANKLNFSTVILNEGNGSSAAGADIRMTGHGVISVSNNMYLNFSDAGATGRLVIGRGTRTSSATPLVTIHSSGLISSHISTYETLVTSDDHIPNKKYVDDAVSGASGGASGSLSTHTADLSAHGATSSLTASRIVKRNGNGQILASNPSSSNHCATLGWTNSQITSGLAANANGHIQVAILHGTVSTGGYVPIPSGYSESQCRWMISWRGYVGDTGAGLDGIDVRTIGGGGTNRLVISRSKHENSNVWFNVGANYIVIGVK